MKKPTLSVAKPADRRLRTAIIGAGYWGPNLIRAFFDDPRVELKVVCDKDEARLKLIASRYRGLVTTPRSEDIIGDESIEAVVVCTPTATHYQIAKACLERGKHVLVEKPMATSAADCKSLMETAERTGARLMVGHIFVYNPGVRYVKELIQSQALGDLIYMYATRVNLGPIRSDVDVLWDLAPHDISIFNYWLSEEPTEVSATGKIHLDAKLHDVVFASLKYPGGVLAHMHVSWLDPRKTRQIVVVGKKQMITFNDLDPLGPVYVYDKHVDIMSTKPEVGMREGVHTFKTVIQEGTLTIPRIPTLEPLREECKAFLDWILEGKEPASVGKDGIAVVRVLEAATRSLSQATGWVEVDNTDLPMAKVAG